MVSFPLENHRKSNFEFAFFSWKSFLKKVFFFCQQSKPKKGVAHIYKMWNNNFSFSSSSSNNIFPFHIFPHRATQRDANMVCFSYFVPKKEENSQHDVLSFAHAREWVKYYISSARKKSRSGACEENGKCMRRNVCVWGCMYAWEYIYVYIIMGKSGCEWVWWQHKVAK